MSGIQRKETKSMQKRNDNENSNAAIYVGWEKNMKAAKKKSKRDEKHEKRERVDENTKNTLGRKAGESNIGKRRRRKTGIC